MLKFPISKATNHDSRLWTPPLKKSLTRSSEFLNAIFIRSLHENNEDDIDPSDPIDDHQRSTSARPTTTTTTSTTTSKPSKPSTTPSSGAFSHPTGYPQHFQPQPPFPQVHTSQSKSLYDDKNSGYHHQYIFHNGERNNNQQATSYQLFSNQGVSSTTVQPPQVHQIRFSSTASPQIIHNEPSTASPLFHATSSTIQTLLNSNGNSPALINPIFHNHGIASTTEQFIHSNNPRETSDYRESGVQSIRPLEVVQSSNKGQVTLHWIDFLFPSFFFLSYEAFRSSWYKSDQADSIILWLYDKTKIKDNKTGGSFSGK